MKAFHGREEHPGLPHMKFFTFLWGNFAYLNPDSDSTVLIRYSLLSDHIVKAGPVRSPTWSDPDPVHICSGCICATIETEIYKPLCWHFCLFVRSFGNENRNLQRLWQPALKQRQSSYLGKRKVGEPIRKDLRVCKPMRLEAQYSLPIQPVKIYLMNFSRSWRPALANHRKAPKNSSGQWKSIFLSGWVNLSYRVWVEARFFLKPHWPSRIDPVSGWVTCGRSLRPDLYHLSVRNVHEKSISQ